jgi:hypothetical protein
MRKVMMSSSLASIGALIMLLCSQHADTKPNVSRAVNNSGRQESTLHEARRIWEQAVAAKGGRDRLHAVQNLVISTGGNYTRGSGETNTVRTEAFFVLPNKIWRWMDYRPDVLGLTVETYNFDSGVNYIITSDDPPPIPQAVRPSETSISHTHGLLTYLLETRWLKPELISASTERIGQRMVEVVHTTLRDEIDGFVPENKYIDFAFDRETHLPIRVSYFHKRGDTKVLDVAENLSDYTEVNGIKVPQKGEVDGSVEKIRIQINVPYNADIFTKPPSVAAGPEAWKITKR